MRRDLIFRISAEFSEAAKEKAPCVIFIDKIDSIWAHRTGRGLGPGMNEVLNQLLYEIDG